MKTIPHPYHLLASLSAVTLLAASEPDRKPLSYNKDIAPIVNQNCAGCHRPGEVAPFSLLNYEEVKKRDKQIARVTHSHYMPPWKAEPGFGEFAGVRRLSDEQIATIKAWAGEGSIEGDPADLKPPPKFADTWHLGPPDLTLKLSKPYKVPAEGRDDFRCFILPSGITEDKYVTAVEFRPGNRRVVHHALFFLDINGAARKKEKVPGEGYQSFGGPGFIPSGALGGWAPGAIPQMLPDGTARLMKKGSDLVVQIHFHPSGKPEEEQSEIGIYFAKKTPEKIIQPLTLNSRNIDIPAGEKAYKVTDSFTLPVDVRLILIAPHAHWICKEMKGNATLPDGTVKPLIWIKDWDFNWQGEYVYKEPLKLPKNTRLDLDFTYDNSADNPRNPSDPPRRVHFGEQTADEMAFLFMQCTTENDRDSATLKGAVIAHRFTGKNGQGLVQELLKRLKN